MFTDTGKVICMKCHATMRLVTINPISIGRSLVTFECSNCGHIRGLQTGPIECRPEGIAA